VIGTAKAKGITTFAKMAFGTEYNPQQADASRLTDDLLKPLAGDNPEHIPLLRMLWWESWGLVTSDMRRAAEGGTDGPRKLGAPELKTRREETTRRLAGLTITPDLDVSDQLITDCVGIVDRNRLKYVPWEQCTARTLEITGGKVDTTWSTDSRGFLKCESGEATQQVADTASDYNLDLALRRRGLAFEMADLMGWEAHEKLRNDLMSSLSRPPIPGYGKVTKIQLKRADEIAFGLLSKATEGGVKRVAGERPLDKAVEAVLNHREYNLALQPLQQAPNFPRPDKRISNDQTGSSNKAPRQDWNTNPNPNPKGKGKKGQKGDKGKGKGKKDAKAGHGAPLPAELRGLPGVTGTDESGAPLCFAFNVGTCDKALPGQRCPKGLHKCALATCRQPHGYYSHHGR